jgi:hypothetical protein
MKTLAPLVLATLGLAACSSAPQPIGAPSMVTLFGPETRLESWSSFVVEKAHVHPGGLGPCPVTLVEPLTKAMSEAASPESKDPVEKFSRSLGSLMETTMTGLQGAPYGGEKQTVLVLRRYAGDVPVEGLFVELPLLRADEADRVFRKEEIRAAFERPLRQPEATLDHGWVRATRTAPDRVTFDLFLVLKPIRPDAYEALQIVSRVDWTPR